MNETKATTKKSTSPKFEPDIFNTQIKASKEIEESILAALLIDSESFHEISDILKPEMFSYPKHRTIYETILFLSKKKIDIDLITLSEELKNKNKLDEIGGRIYLVELTNKISSTAHIESHVRLLHENYIERRVSEVGVEIFQKAASKELDALDLIDFTSKKITDIQNSIQGSNQVSMSLGVFDELKLIEQRMAKAAKGDILGVPSGFKWLDATTGGWQKSDLIIVAGRPSMGKCLGRGTPVIMYDGSIKRVEEIKQGDLLMGVDSSPRKVVSLANGTENMYLIKQRFGMDYVVNESHILSLKRSRNESKHKNGDILNISVSEYLSKSPKFKSNYKGWKTEIEFPVRNVLIEPYFLGIWLGDGKKDSQKVYKPDQEIEDYIRSYAKRLEMKFIKSKEKCPAYSINVNKEINNRLLSRMRIYRLFDNKHIPKDYLINNKENRLELLAGLLDSDGHYNSEYHVYEITMINENLMNQIKFLCDTLGFRTTLKPKKASIKKIGFECTAYRLRIYGNLDIIPCKIKRKKAREYRSNRNWRHTSFEIKEQGLGEYFGFTLDKDGLFILGDGTVTHNTAATLNFARNAALIGGYGVGIFSLEMNRGQLIARMMSAEAEVENDKLRSGRMNDSDYSRLTSSIDALSNANIIIDDTPALSIFELKARARRMKTQKNIGLIIIDYLQLMSGSGKKMEGSREQEISSISRGLKALAKELDVPVIALSQLSRAVESRGGEKKPMLSDLRESGSIEQDADIVIFLYRPEYYGIPLEDGSDSKGFAEFIIAKHRNGSLNKIKVQYVSEYTKFKDWDFLPTEDEGSGSSNLKEKVTESPKTKTTIVSQTDLDYETPF